MRHLSLDEFTSHLASADPTPGGGSASAVAGAFGAALIAMLARLSTGRGGDDALFTRTAEGMDRVRTTLLDLAAQDARAFDVVMAATRMPRRSDEEKQARTSAVQRAMRDAAEVPLDVAGQAVTVLEAACQILPTANPNAASDGGVAVLLSYAAAQGAIANVRINLASIREEAYRTATAVRVEDLAQRSTALRDQGMVLMEERLTR